jgi:hypothetical protein
LIFPKITLEIPLSPALSKKIFPDVVIQECVGLNFMLPPSSSGGSSDVEQDTQIGEATEDEGWEISSTDSESELELMFPGLPGMWRPLDTDWELKTACAGEFDRCLHLV